MCESEKVTHVDMGVTIPGSDCTSLPHESNPDPQRGDVGPLDLS